MLILSFFQCLSLFFDQNKQTKRQKNVNSEQNISYKRIYYAFRRKIILFVTDYRNKYLFPYYQPTNVKKSHAKIRQMPEQPQGILNVVIHKP